MFLFQEDRPAENLHEKKLQVLKHLVWWNTSYSIAFDEEDLVFRQELLRQGTSYCWLGAGMLGMGAWNVRWMLQQGKVAPRVSWMFGASILLTIGLTMSRVYFALKIDGLDYVAKKYVLQSPVQLPHQE